MAEQGFKQGFDFVLTPFTPNLTPNPRPALTISSHDRCFDPFHGVSSSKARVRIQWFPAASNDSGEAFILVSQEYQASAKPSAVH